eukprot:scaffold437007_cov29-Prasinocladus_malaysianus.AAC.1
MGPNALDRQVVLKDSACTMPRHDWHDGKYILSNEAQLMCRCCLNNKPYAKSGMRIAIFYSAMLSLLARKPLGGVDGAVRENDVGAGSAEAGHGFQDGILLVQPPALGSSLDHSILAAHVVGRNGKGR